MDFGEDAVRHFPTGLWLFLGTVEAPAVEVFAVKKEFPTLLLLGRREGVGFGGGKRQGEE